MKKWCCIMMVLLCTLTLGQTALADGDTQVPASIASALSGSRWDGYSVAYTTQRGAATGEVAAAYDSQHNCAAAVVTNGKMNILVLMGSDGKGGLKVVSYSDKAVLQGDDIPGIRLQNERITVYYPSDSGEQWNLSYTFRRRDSTWILNNLSYFDGNDTIAIEVYDAKLTYENTDVGSFIGTATGVYGRRFEQFNVNTFPRTLKDAKAVLTLPPAIPESVSVYSLAQPQEIEFSSNKKYPVYSAPGTDTLRGASGKAAMSTNDWVQVFGRENNWILVQYDISSDKMRFGYISSDSLPKGVSVPELSFLYLPVHLSARCSLTDDPLNSGSVLGTPDSQDVTFLAWLGNDWAYVETTIGGVRTRGFVPAAQVEDFTDNGFHG